MVRNLKYHLNSLGGNMQNQEEIILNDIKEMLSQMYPDVEITMDTFLEFGGKSYLDMSSIEIVQFIVDIEKKYDIIVDFEDRYYTIGDTVRGIISSLAEKKQEMSGDENEFKI